MVYYFLLMSVTSYVSSHYYIPIAMPSIEVCQQVLKEIKPNGHSRCIAVKAGV